MKILILSDIEAGGEWIATQTLIEKLKIKNSHLKFYLIAFLKNRYLIKEFLFEKIIFVKQKYYKKPFKYYRELFYQLNEGVRTIDKTCKKYIFDCVITIDYKLATSYLISQKKLNFIYYFHGLKNRSKRFNDYFIPYVVFQKFLEILALTMSKKIIAPSIQAKTHLTNNYGVFIYGKKFDVVPNLIRDEFNINHSLVNNNNEKIILYSGRLDPNKGIRNLLYAFLKLRNQHPELSLAIAYFGKPETQLFNEIKIFINKGQKIRLLRDPEITDLVKLYQNSYLGILPSSFEISSLFLREALICNLPIISTSTGDTSKLLSNNFILKDNFVNTIIDKIDDFIKNERIYKNKFQKIVNDYKSQNNEEITVNHWIKVI